MKRDGNTVVNALYADTLWAAGAASKASGLLKQIEFAPLLVDQLKTHPDVVVRDLHELRKYCTPSSWSVSQFSSPDDGSPPPFTEVTDPSNLRVSVAGNILGLQEPRSAWTKNYESVSVSQRILSPFLHCVIDYTVPSMSSLALSRGNTNTSQKLERNLSTRHCNATNHVLQSSHTTPLCRLLFFPFQPSKAASGCTSPKYSEVGTILILR